MNHGLAFLHGRSTRWLAELAAARDATWVDDWPRVRVGHGVPCQPRSFDATDTRVALEHGVSCFAKRLAIGLDVRLGSRVESLTLALTMPAPSVIARLRRIDTPVPAVAALLPLLELIRVLPCLTVIARYPAGTAAPPWQISYPSEGDAVHTILHDSSKRPGAARNPAPLRCRRRAP